MAGHDQSHRVIDSRRAWRVRLDHGRTGSAIDGGQGEVLVPQPEVLKKSNLSLVDIQNAIQTANTALSVKIYTFNDA